MWKHTQIIHIGKEKKHTRTGHTHTPKKQMALLHNLLLLFTLICHFMLSLRQKKKKKKGKEL